MNFSSLAQNLAASDHVAKGTYGIFTTTGSATPFVQRSVLMPFAQPPIRAPVSRIMLKISLDFVFQHAQLAARMANVPAVNAYAREAIF